MSLIFIHGIAIRQERFDQLLNCVVNGFRQAQCTLTVSGCYWGDLGRSSSYSGASIPGFSAGVRAIGTHLESSDEASLMMLLLEDPLAELATLRDKAELTPVTAGFRPLPSEVVVRNDALSSAEALLRERALSLAASAAPRIPLVPDPVSALVHSVFEAAARTDRTLDSRALCDPIARAITAGLYGIAGASDGLWTDFRWNDTMRAVQAALDDQFGGERGPFRDLGSTALTSALRHGMRNRVMPGLSLFLGDVMSWFRNREAILHRVEEAVTAANLKEPLVLLGHSLGGVIAFEYCAEVAQDIRLLATVGSQVGLFGELGVLHAASRSRAGKLVVPDNVQSWRNMYDPDDALSFLAAPVFDGVVDVEFDTRAPFPVCHSEYWNLADMYRKLTAVAASS
jgi:hypothetical protein